jgi:hypothetical protein
MKPMVSYLLIQSQYYKNSLGSLLLSPHCSGGFGFTAGVRKAVVDLAPATLIYISCNPATLARDLKELREKFTIESVTPLDMFPQTAEIEVAVHLRHKELVSK